MPKGVNKSEILKKLSWEDYTLIAFVLFFTLFYSFYISGYSQLPSPIFGGDLYRDRGFVENIVAGNPVWSDAFYVNEVQYYPYLVFAIEAGIVKITGISIDHVFLFFPIIALILSSFVWYKLGSRLFKKKIWGLIAALAMLCLQFSISPKAAIFDFFVLAPAFFYFWLKYEQENNKKDAIFAGIFLGANALVYGGVFLSIAAMFLLAVAIKFIWQSYKNRKIIENLILAIKKYYLIAIIGLGISMIYFLPLIIVYKWHVVNEVTKWGDYGLQALGPMWVLKTLQNMFLNFKNLFAGIVSLVSLAGLIALIFSKKNKELWFLLMLVITDIIAMEHHLITLPLLHTYFVPTKLLYFNYLLPLFFTLGALVIYNSLKNQKMKNAAVAVVLIILLGFFAMNFSEYKSSQWEKVGRSDPTYVRSLYGLGGWIEKNVGKNEAILSNDETGFMLSVVSGRKVMLTRRTHASYFVDIDKRIADATVAMYGPNITLSKEILKEYNVQYFYIDSNLFQYPMRARPEFESYLLSNGVNFTKAYDRYDIAVPLELATGMELLIIPPENLTQSFTDLWTPVYNVQVNGQVVGQLLKLKE